jgi:hypothetical protein
MSVNTSFLKRIVPEDFDSKYQSLISKLASVLNPAIDQIANILNNGLDVSDLNVLVKQITVQVGPNGNPLTAISIASTLSSHPTMMQVGRAYNLTNPNTYVTAAPFLTFTPNGTQITINNITGLTPNDSWQLTVIAYV